MWPLSVAAELLEPALAALAVFLFAAALLGEPLYAFAAFMALAAGGTTLIHRSLAAAAPNARGSGAVFRIAHANLLDSPKAAARFAAWAGERAADIVAITEPPPGALDALKPLFASYPFSMQSDDAGRRRVIVFSKLRLEQRDSSDINILRLAARSDDACLEVACAHPTIPISPAFESRRNVVIERAFAAAHAANAPAVVIGDLNTTPAGPVLDAMRRAFGFRRAGAGLFSTTWMAPVFGLGLTLDHICVSTHCASRSYEIGPLIGSDHRPIFAEIEI
ncbi:MAG: endonuclease/exonuclease/phosphatase family protein [Amphiplicatus sp.]